MDRVRAFCKAAHHYTGRFTDHEEARKQGLPSAIVPGIMSQALVAAEIHHWSPGFGGILRPAPCRFPPHPHG